MNVRSTVLLLALAASVAVADDVPKPSSPQQKDDARRAEEAVKAAQEREEARKRDQEAADRARQQADARRADEAARAAKEREMVVRQRAQQAAVAGRLQAVAVQRNSWDDAQFERWVFQRDTDAATARRRFDTLLALQVEEIDRACRLTAEQKQKLRMIGHGDLKRIFDSFDAAKRRFHALDNDINQLSEIMPDLKPVQTAAQNGPFTDDSLFIKSLHYVLTPEQAARYDAVANERRQYRHRARIELAVGTLEQALPMRDKQRQGLIDLLVKETKPTRTTGVYDFYLTMYQISKLPEEKVRPLFTAAEWRHIERQLAQYNGIVPNLRANGMLDEDDERAER
jgi:hypothetical protein